MINIYNAADVSVLINRIDQLNENKLPQWGSMNAAQMLAHCNIAYQYAYEPHLFEKPTFFKRFLLKVFVKKYVVTNKPYKQNSSTAPEFKITEVKDFENEKKRLIDNLNKTLILGRTHFEGLENSSFGKLTADQWNILFSKHLDYHLKQFNV